MPFPSPLYSDLHLPEEIEDLVTYALNSGLEHESSNLSPIEIDNHAAPVIGEADLNARVLSRVNYKTWEEATFGGSRGEAEENSEQKQGD